MRKSPTKRQILGKCAKYFKGLGALEQLFNSYLMAQITLFGQSDKFHSRNYLVTTLSNAAFLASRAYHQGDSSMQAKYANIVGEKEKMHGTKSYPTWFLIFCNPKSSCLLVCTTKKIS